MKNFILISLLAIIALIVWLFLTKQDIHHNQSMDENQTTNEATSRQQKTNLFVMRPSDSTTPANAQPTQAIPASAEVPNAITATNLEQWKSLIKELRYSEKFADKPHNGWESWVMEWPERNSGVPVTLEIKGRQVVYPANFIDVDALLVGGKIQSVKMHSPIMSIDETRELGLKLCNLLELDPKDFLSWCDKVGNHWLDAPLYSSQGNSNLGFETLRTYDDGRPWFINFVIANRR